MVEIDFNVGFDRGGPQLPDAFDQIEKCCSWPKLSHFEILKIQEITVRVRTLIAFYRKLWPILEFQNLYSPTFFIQSS